jgi:starch synthase
LADTIVHASAEHLAAGTANGFAFDAYDARSLDTALGQACDVFSQDPATWNQLVTTGMQQDWSWTASAQRYVQLYEKTIQRAKQTVCA